MHLNAVFTLSRPVSFLECSPHRCQAHKKSRQPRQKSHRKDKSTWSAGFSNVKQNVLTNEIGHRKRRNVPRSLSASYFSTPVRLLRVFSQNSVYVGCVENVKIPAVADGSVDPVRPRLITLSTRPNHATMVPWMSPAATALIRAFAGGGGRAVRPFQRYSGCQIWDEGGRAGGAYREAGRERKSIWSLHGDSI